MRRTFGKNLAKQIKSYGMAQTVALLESALHSGEINPDSDISLRELAESLVPNGREWVDSLNPQHGGGGIQFLDSESAVSLGAFSNITGQIVYSRLMQAFNLPYAIAMQTIPTVSSTLSGEKIAGMTQIGDESETVGEGKEYPRVGFTEDYQETPATTKRGLIIEVTKEAIFFDRTGMILNRVKEVGEWLGINKEKRLLDLMIGVTNNYKWKGTTYNTYNASTPWANIKTSNALADWTDIENAELLFDALRDPWTGEPITVVPNTIIVASGLKHTAKHILQSTQIRNATNTAAIQTYSPSTLDDYKILSSPLLGKRQLDNSLLNTTWYLGDPAKAFAYIENWPVQVVQAPSNSEAEFTRDIVLRYKASERGAAAVMQPRAMVQNTVA